MAARVHQREAAGAVGVLGQARAEAGLAGQRRLLIARDARDRESPRPECSAAVVPDTPLDGTIRGSMARGMSKMRSRSSSQSPVARFMSIVRDALEDR